MGHIKFIGGLLMAILFSIAIIGYAVDFGNDNDAVVNLADDSLIVGTKTNLETDTETYNLQTNSSLKAMFDAEISAGDETSRTGGQFKGGVSGVFSGITNVIRMGYQRIIGQEEGYSGKGIFLTALISFLGFVMGMYIWKVWAGKNPD